jgi:uncharacterized peroxidase-related enzyme
MKNGGGMSIQVLTPIDASTAGDRVRELFGAVEQRLKRVPNMLRLMGNSPAILGAYLQFIEAFEHTRLPPKLRSLITAAVSELNGCVYTVSTAMALGRREGVTKDEFMRARRAESSDPKTAAALRFAAAAVRERGHVPPAEVAGLRDAGFSDEEIVEIIGAVALNLFRNYFNLIAGTEVDFPLVRAGDTAA